MDETPRRLERWLPFLGIALLVEAVLAILTPALVNGAFPPVRIVNGLLVAIAGTACLVTSRASASFPYPRAILVLIFLAMGSVQLLGFGRMQGTHRLDAFALFYVASHLLMSFGAPILWGSALMRRENPASSAAEKSGRMSAGLLQLGFVFMFVAELWTFNAIAHMASQSPGVLALFAIGRVIEVAARILLLWSSVDAVRLATDETVVLRRMDRTTRFMGWWFGLHGLGAILENVQGFQQTDMDRVMILGYGWRSVVVLTATLAAALAVARHLRVVYGSYKSEPPPHPWSGAEA